MFGKLGEELKTTDFDQVADLYRQLPKYKPCKRGRFSIEEHSIPGNEEIQIVSIRQAIFEGKRPLRVLLPHAMTVHQLKDTEHGTWMSTQLQEIAQMVEPYDQAHGDVLIGGLGLGVIAHLMANKDEVRSVKVVEKELDLIELVQPYLNPFIEVIHGDLFRYLKRIKPTKSWKFDFGFFDIWQSTGEWTWQTQVVPLRRSARRSVKDLLCWQEQEMAGQVEQGCYWAVDAPAEMLFDHASLQHRWVIRKAAIETGIRDKNPRFTLPSGSDGLKRKIQIEEENRQDEGLRLLVHQYCYELGTDLWEERFGHWWDATLTWPSVKKAFKLD